MTELISENQIMTTQPIIRNPVLQTQNTPMMQPTYNPEDIGNLISQVNSLKQQMEKISEENAILKNQLQELQHQNQELLTENMALQDSRPPTSSSNYEQDAEITENQLKIIDRKKVYSQLFPRNYRPITPYTVPTWEQEEEMVDRETNFLQKSKKRKQISNPTTPNKKNQNVQDNIGLHKSATKAKKPPPAIVYTNNIKVLNVTLKDIEHNMTCVSENKVKINTANSDDYRKMTAALNLQSFEWYSYENKQTRDIKVMARNLHNSTDVDDIYDDLVHQGFEIKNVVQKLKITRGTNGERMEKRLPLFMLTFSDRTDIKKVYEIKYIDNMKVTIEALRTNKMIPQCKKCQEYGHTRVYCRKSPRCVKCAGNHLTDVCEKPRNIEAKCANCEKNHPANYRGCEVAKKLQQKRNQNSNRKPTKDTPEESTTHKQNLTNTKVTPNLTFAQLVKNNLSGENKQKSMPKQNTNDNEMLHLMKIMMQKVESIEKSNKTLSNKINSIENRIPSNKKK